MRGGLRRPQESQHFSSVPLGVSSKLLTITGHRGTGQFEYPAFPNHSTFPDFTIVQEVVSLDRQPKQHLWQRQTEDAR